MRAVRRSAGHRTPVRRRSRCPGSPRTPNARRPLPRRPPPTRQSSWRRWRGARGGAGGSRDRGRTALPLSHVELAFCTRPLAGEMEPGMPIPTVPRRAGLLLELGDHVADGAERGRIVVSRGGDAMLRHDCAVGPERHACNLAAAEIDAEAHLAASPGCAVMTPRSRGRPAAEGPARGRSVSGATEALAAKTSSSNSSPTRCSSTAARNSGAPARARTSAGVESGERQEPRQPRRLLRQERKPLSGNGFRRFQGQRLRAPIHVGS